MVNHGNIISANCFLVSELRDDCHCVSSACLLLSCSGFNPKCGMNESFFVHILARCDFAFGIQNNTNQYSAAALLGTVMLCSSLRFNVGDHEQDLEEGSNRQAWHFGAISLKASCRRYISIPCPIRMIPAPQFLSVCTCEAVIIPMVFKSKPAAGKFICIEGAARHVQLWLEPASALQDQETRKHCFQL